MFFVVFVITNSCSNSILPGITIVPTFAAPGVKTYDLAKVFAIIVPYIYLSNVLLLISAKWCVHRPSLYQSLQQ